MTMTESAPDTYVEANDRPIVESYSGLTDLVTTGDHKTIGMMYVRLSLLFAVGILAIGAVVGFEQSDFGGAAIFSSTDQMFQFWTLARVGLVFLVVLPLFIGLGTAIVPLQVGSTAIAFPRAMAAAFWTWLVGAGVFVAGVVTDGGLGTPNDFSFSDAVALTIMGLGTMVVALLLASICIVATVVSLRPSGMALHRVPAFSWSMFIGGIGWMLSLPLLLANLVIAYADLRGRAPVGPGQEAIIWEQVRWAFNAPQVFMYAVPALGIAAEVVPVAAKARQKFFPVVLGAIAAFGLLGFGGYLQTSFAGGQARAFFADPADRWNDGIIFVLQAAVLALPALILLGGLAGTLRRGRVRAPQAWMAAGFLSALLLLAAAALNLGRSIPWLELIGTSADSGIANAVLIVSLLGATGGVFYWMPKLTGNKMANPVGMLSTLALLGGAALAGLAPIVAGFLDQPDVDSLSFINASFVLEDGVEIMNLVAAAGFAIAAAGAGLVLLEVARVSVTNSTDAENDPWGGFTLEWSTVSPPPLGNFAEPVDAVVSESPLLDLREAAAEDA